MKSNLRSSYDSFLIISDSAVSSISFFLDFHIDGKTNSDELLYALHRRSLQRKKRGRNIPQKKVTIPYLMGSVSKLKNEDLFASQIQEQRYRTVVVRRNNNTRIRV